VLKARMEPADWDYAYAGSVRGSGPVFALADHGQEGLLELAFRLKGRCSISVAEKPFTLPVTGSAPDARPSRAGRTKGAARTAETGEAFPAGSWIVEGGEGLAADLKDLVAFMGLDFVSMEKVPDVPVRPVRPPRLGVYETWTATQDSGWVRYTLDRAGIPYAMLHDAEIRSGNLASWFDVILVPDTWGELKDIVQGIDPKFSPLPYASTPEAAFGTDDAITSDDITGGVGWSGLDKLHDFVRQGGVLVCLGNAGTLAVDGGLTRQVRRVRTKELQVPGSEVQARFRRRDHPIARGYGELPSVFLRQDPLWEVDKKDDGLVVLQFGAGLPDEQGGSKSDLPFLLSGLVKGEKEILGKPAVLDVPVGKGRVVLFGFNPLHRYLNHSDFRMVYNALLYWDQLP
jgi:hypothetical protein